MSNVITYKQLNATNAINIARDLSWLNSKNEEVSSRDGDVMGYLCDMHVVSDAAAQLSLLTASNSWKMRNSFKKWHAYREMMFKEAGVSVSEQGRYGKTIRPYLNNTFKGLTLRTPLLSGDSGEGTGVATMGEWTYTKIAATPGYVEAGAGTEGASIVDVYDLSLCGENTVTATSAQGTERYSNVGMIHSYNLDRMEVVTPGSKSTIEGQNNPLALLRYKGASAGEVMEITEEQELELPPYDLRDAGDSVFPIIAAIGQVSPGWNGTAAVPSKTVLRNIFIPAGLCVLTATSGGTEAASAILIKVNAKILCKEMA